MFADPAVLEVVVVVDGSTDGSLELLRDRAADEPRLRPVWQENGGEGAARQCGMSLSRGDIVLFLDDDVVPAAGLASGHADAHRQHPSSVVLGALLTRPRPRSVDSVTTDLYISDYASEARAYVDEPAGILDHLWAGNMSLARGDAVRVGLSNPEMARLFHEDTDLGLRLKAAGLGAVFRPDLIAEHVHTRSLRKFLGDSVRQGRAEVILHRTYPGQVPAPTGPHFAGWLPTPARQLVLVAARSPFVGQGIAETLLAGCRALGVLKMWGMQRRTAFVLCRVGQAIGAGRQP